MLRHLLPPTLFSLLFCNSFFFFFQFSLDLSLISLFSFPPELLMLSLYHDSSSHPGLVHNKYITQHLSSPAPIPIPLPPLSEKRRGVIVFVSHIPVVPPQGHHWVIMSYCKYNSQALCFGVVAYCTADFPALSTSVAFELFS